MNHKLLRCINGKTAQERLEDLPKINVIIDYKAKLLEFHEVIQILYEMTSNERVHVTAQ